MKFARLARMHISEPNLLCSVQECEDLRANIAAQTISRDDVIRMNNERYGCTAHDYDQHL